MSTEWDGVERRASPRVVVRGGADCRVIVRTRVRLLDLSEEGALVSTDAWLPAGCVGQLTTGFATGTFASTTEVLRERPGRKTDTRELGVRFQRMDSASRTQLESFLQRAARA